VREGEALWSVAFGDDGEGDFVRLFAFPFPAVVIAVLLGVRGNVATTSVAGPTTSSTRSGGGDPSLAEEANRQLFVLVDQLVAERRRLHDLGEELPGDVVSVLTRAKADGTLGHGEVRRLCQQLLVAGHETTASLLSLMLYRLVERPELLDELRTRPDLVPSAVEEFLRFDSPVQGLFRVNLEPAEVRGVELPAAHQAAGVVRIGEPRRRRVGGRRHDPSRPVRSGPPTARAASRVRVGRAPLHRGAARSARG
jgi:cytochrome P450